MIDVHCHILPALDDGALDLDDAVDMARQAEVDGIAVVKVPGRYFATYREAMRLKAWWQRSTHLGFGKPVVESLGDQ